MPFDAETTTASARITLPARPSTSRTVCDGTTLTTKRLSRTAASRSAVAVSDARQRRRRQILGVDALGLNVGRMIRRSSPQRDVVALVRQHFGQRRPPAACSDDCDLRHVASARRGLSYCSWQSSGSYRSAAAASSANLTVYDAGDALLCVDCGGQIPDDESPGVDLFIPDFAYLASRASEVVGWLATHAHEDHIAALPHALAVAPAPVYARPLTLALLRGSIDESQLRPLVPGAVRQLGPFTVEALAVAHSIPDACAVVITVTGDASCTPAISSSTRRPWRRPTSSGCARSATPASISLVADSTNATRPGRSGSETDVARALVARARAGARAHRVYVLLVERAAHRDGVRRLRARRPQSVHRGARAARDGRGGDVDWRATSGRRICSSARDVAATLPPSRVALLLTGSQGEPRAALGRVASGEHPLLTLGRGDTLVLSSRPVPGNERAIARVVDRILALGVRVVDAPALHASGHAAQDELRELMQLVRPRTLLPIHGGRRQLFAHADSRRVARDPLLRARRRRRARAP